MNTVFVHSFWKTTRSYSHAVAALAAEMGRLTPLTDVRLVTVRNGDSDAAALEIAALQPDIVFFTSMSSQWRLIADIGGKVRAKLDRPLLVVGGVHPTARPHTPLADNFDVVVLGEGETVLRRILEETSALRLMADKEKRPVRLRATAVDDLTILRPPRLDLFDQGDLLAYPSVMFSRGCPFKCNYCMSRLGGITGKVRWKSPEQAVSEIEQLIELTDCPQVLLDDDTLLKNPKWVRAFCSLYQRRIGRPFLCNARPETISPDKIEVLASAGCSGIGIGIESGSPEIRASLGRPMTDEMIVEAFATVRRGGIRTWSFNMVGMPGETESDVRATIDLNRRARVDDVRVSIFTPYPGSPMGEEVEIGEPGYFRSADELAPDLRETYRQWLTELKDQDRLWVTESERGLLEDSRH